MRAACRGRNSIPEKLESIRCLAPLCPQIDLADKLTQTEQVRSKLLGYVRCIPATELRSGRKKKNLASALCRSSLSLPRMLVKFGHERLPSISAGAS